MVNTNTAVLAFLLLTSALSLQAASIKDGAAAIKGAGVASCQQLLQANKKGSSTELSIYGGWVDGFLTATNIHEKDTFDIATWQSTNTMLSAIIQHCKKHPQLNFFKATSQMISHLYTKRLHQRSEIAKIEQEGTKLLIYTEVLRKIQQRLSELKLYTGNIDGSYSKPTQAALSAFQKKHELPITRLPDQRTLLFLFAQKTRQSR